jgi:predicted PhzF superfamily epimerase YddE/YHI9
LNDFPNNSSKTNFSKLLKELDLIDNYFSVRGELVFVNTQKKEIVIKIKSVSKLKNLKNKNFKLVIKGELSLELLNSFVSLDINRDGNALNLIKYEVIEKNLSENK